VRRLTLTLAAAGLLLPFGAPPASAHTGFEIAGYQFLYQQDFGAGLSGWLSLPTGPAKVTDGPSDDGLTAITNHDGVRHTFTECTTQCDQALPAGGNYAGASFDVSVASGATVDLESLPLDGTYVFGCRVHPFMRGQITIHPG
jgi:hypothetical protein